MSDKQPILLIAAYLEGYIEDEDFLSLQGWLKASAEHADYFMHQVMLIQHLRDRFDTQENSNPEEFLDLIAQLGTQREQWVLFDKKHSRHRRDPAFSDNHHKNQALQAQQPAPDRHRILPHVLGLAGIAAVLGFAIWISLFVGNGGEPDEPNNSVAVDTPSGTTGSELTSVAFVTREMNAQWGGSAPGKDKVLGEGQRIYLEKGLAQVYFASGVEVTLQGPVHFQANGRNAAEITTGRLTAEVPSQAVGFTVQTPKGLITDYGTEFGVTIDQSGNVDTHVFAGEVTFSPAETNEVITLHEGDAVRAVRADKVQRIEIDRKAFVRNDDFKALLAKQEAAYRRWLAYSQELRRDQAMVAYYAFSIEDELAGQLTNVAQATSDGLHSELFSSAASSPSWESGRFPQKRGLRFDRTRPQWVTIPHDERLNPGDAITIACWINRAGEGDRSGIFVSKLDGYQSAFSYQLGGFDGESAPNARKLQFVTGVVNVGARESSPVFAPSPDGWEHIAATYDGQTVRFYHNGQPAGVMPMSMPMSASKSDLLIGRDALKPGAEFNAFGGVMDEVCILSRAMSAEEIEQMYAHGVPGDYKQTN